MKRTIRITSMLLAIVMAVSFSACNDQTDVSRTDSNATDTTISSNVDSAEVSSDTETSKEETSSDTSSSKSETSSDTDPSESSATTTAVTTTTNKTTTTNSTSSPKEEKIEEREVYDENGNVVDKIKVKVVDGVAYTVGEKSDDKCILGGVPLYTNDPEFPSGDIITMVQTALYMKGQEITQKEIFEKYVEYHTPDEWYEKDGINYGPKLGGKKLDRDPRKGTTEYFNGFLGNAQEYIEEYCDEFSLNCKDYSLEFSSRDYMYTIKELISNDYLPLIQTTREAALNWSWITEEYTGVYETQGIFSGWYCYVAIGYINDMCMVYDLGSSMISLREKYIIDVRAF